MVARGFQETATKENVNQLTQRVVSLEQRVAGVETSMVTKSYLDEKMADLEGIVVIRQRKEDQKVNLLIDFLRKKKLLNKQEIKMLQDFQVFPTASRRL